MWRKVRKRFCIGIVFCICLTIRSAAFGGWQEFSKLIAPDGGSYDQFGQAVSISGDYAIIGSTGDDDSGSNAGAAYVFQCIGPDWVFHSKLLGSDIGAGENFGKSVSLEGPQAIIGANYEYYNRGASYIFTLQESNWTETAKLASLDRAPYDYFGCSVSICGDYAIVGAEGDDDNGSISGSAYIFKRTGSSWTQQAKLLANDGASYDQFGISVAIDDNYVAVGANMDCDKGVNSGSVYIFKRDELGAWSQVQKLTASDGAANDYFGLVVDFDSGYLIVGAWGDDDVSPVGRGLDSGSAYIFKRVGETWTQQAKLFASDGATGDAFGLSVSINGNLAAIGARDNDEPSKENCGATYIFERDGTLWNQVTKLTASDGAQQDKLGCSVDLDGDCVIAGAYYDDDRGSNSGSAYLFKNCPVVDLDGSCYVDLSDFAILADQWLQPPGSPSADFAPDGGDGVVDLLDLDSLLKKWLQ